MLLVAAAGPITAAESAPAADPEPGTGAAGIFDWSEFILPPAAGSGTEELDRFGSFAEALSNESPSEAEVLAKQLVESAATDGTDIMRRARALQNLAVAQQVLGEYESALQNYRASIAAVSSAQDNLSPDLVPPLRGLASAFAGTQQSTQAFAALDRALHVSNVNFGPHSLEQLPILESRMQLFLDLDDTASAIEALDRIYMLYTRKYDRYSDEMLPALYLKAETGSRLGMPGEERNAWRHILAIKEKRLAEDDPELIEPNIRLASIYMRTMRKDAFRSVSTSAAEKHLKTALWIAKNSPQATWEMRKDCLLSLADYYTLFDHKARARRYYGEAWDLLSSDQALLAARADSFEAPVPLARSRPDPYAHIEIRPDSEQLGDDDYLRGEVTVRFDVDDRGRAQNPRVVAAAPEKFTRMEIRAVNAVDNFIYRPRFVDGRPADTGGLEYRFRYFYLQDVYESALEKSEKHNRSRRYR